MILTAPCGGAANCNGTTVSRRTLRIQYTTGNLVLNPGWNWTIDGVVRIDGGFINLGPGTLLIEYNDQINHKILTSNFELQVDSTTAIP